MNASSEFTFQFESHAVRVQVDEAGTPWFNANDICTAVELLNPCAALAQHVGARNVSKRKIIDAIGRTQRANHLNESGVYALLIGSTKDTAKRFRQWLISEALPAAAAQKAGQHIIPLHRAPSVSTPFQPTEDHTMNAITPFQFESHAVRTVVDDHGEVWFVGKDIADVLGYADHRKALDAHCKGGAKRLPLPTAGGIQEVRIISEPDMLRLIVSSKLPAAERFERWVFEEVLPTLRKTGTYSTPGALPTLPGPTQDRIAALLLIGQYISTVPGVKPGIAAAATLACIKSNTNLTTEEIRRALPALRDPLCLLNATQLGKQLHCSAKEANQLLASAGLQFRNERDDWELTEAGRVWGEAIPYSRNGHSSYQILWNPTVVDSLKVAA
ncbi:BRO-N domain-containing protein [Xylella fastidiosa]|uniref:BRO-N domain-containing protein n=1 Tax=Xylella fastidiosa TaxID=2371 RepID=UPI00156A0DB6|nr:BRO family protein [Xylella fastidiosa]